MSETNTLTEPVLRPEQLEAFHRDGFVVAKIFEKEDFEPIQALITRWIDQRLEALGQEGKELDAHSESPFEKRAGKMLEQFPGFFNGFDLNTGLLGPEVFAHMSHPRMVAAVSQILEDEVSLNPVMHIRVKPPLESGTTRSGFDNVPWHQDAGVYTEDTDGTTILTCWRPIGDATVEMGCMELIPGVEGPEPLPHGSSEYGTAIWDEILPKTTPVPAPCKIGEVVIMRQYTPHKGLPNLSDKCRWSMDIRYHVQGAPSGRAWQPEAPLTGPKVATHTEWVEDWQNCDDMRTRHRVTQREEEK
jgi:phytanoyl-CoA hydroxylase